MWKSDHEWTREENRNFGGKVHVQLWDTMYMKNQRTHENYEH